MFELGMSQQVLGTLPLDPNCYICTSVQLGENANREQYAPHSECVSVGDDIMTSGRYKTEFRSWCSLSRNWLAEHIAGMGVGIGQLCLAILEGRDYMGGLGVGGRILLKWF